MAETQSNLGYLNRVSPYVRFIYKHEMSYCDGVCMKMVVTSIPFRDTIKFHI